MRHRLCVYLRHRVCFPVLSDNSFNICKPRSFKSWYTTVWHGLVFAWRQHREHCSRNDASHINIITVWLYCHSSRSITTAWQTSRSILYQHSIVHWFISGQVWQHSVYRSVLPAHQNVNKQPFNNQSNQSSINYRSSYLRVRLAFIHRERNPTFSLVAEHFQIFLTQKRFNQG